MPYMHDIPIMNQRVFSFQTQDPVIAARRHTSQAQQIVATHHFSADEVLG
jgi:hypothetical protein